MITTLIKTVDHIDSVVMEAYERFAQGFRVNTESKSILFYNKAFGVFLIAYIDLDLDLDLEEVKTIISNRFKELDEIHGEEG